MSGKRTLFLSVIPLVIAGVMYSWYLYEKNYIPDFPPATGNTCTIFLIDGLDNQIFRDELDKNCLPVMSGLINRGMYVEQGIASFPTMTGYGFFPFITGYDATQSGILGLRWFDRKRTSGNLRNYVGRTNIHMNSDLTDSIQNYFQQSGSYYTASINTYMNKGVKHSLKTGWEHTTAKYEGLSVFKWLRAIPFFGEDIAKDHFQHEEGALQLALRQLERNPKLHWVTFPSPDAYNHVFGTDEKYRQLIRHIDSLIGVYINASDKLGQTDNRMFAIVSDHGISDVQRNLDFCGWAKKELNLNIGRGKSVHFWSSALDDHISDLDPLDGFFVINGNLTAYLYMKDKSRPYPEQWAYPLPPEKVENFHTVDRTIDLAGRIAMLDGIELVCYKSVDGNIKIRNQDGIAIVSAKSDSLQYYIDKANPLQYPDSLCKRYLTRRQWLESTSDSEYPYAIPRLYDLMTQSAIGDIVITSAKGVDLANDYEIFVGNYKGGHGGLRKEIITVPYILYHPNMLKSMYKSMTAEDIGVLIGKYLQFRTPSR